MSGDEEDDERRLSSPSLEMRDVSCNLNERGSFLSSTVMTSDLQLLESWM